MYIPYTFHVIIKRLPLRGAYPQIKLSTSSSKTTTVITLSLVLASTTFSHSSSFTITPTPPTPSPLPDHHSLYLLPFIPNIQAACPLHLTSCKQHTSIILYLRSSQTSPLIPLRLPKFHVTTCSRKRSSGLQSYNKLNLHAPGGGVAPSFL